MGQLNWHQQPAPILAERTTQGPSCKQQNSVQEEWQGALEWRGEEGVGSQGWQWDTCSFVILLQGEQVQQATSIHGFEGHIVLVHHRVGNIQLEALQPHDLVLQAVPGQQPVHIHCALLTQPVCSIHGLHSICTASACAFH